MYAKAQEKVKQISNYLDQLNIIFRNEIESIRQKGENQYFNLKKYFPSTDPDTFSEKIKNFSKYLDEVNTLKEGMGHFLLTDGLINTAFIFELNLFFSRLEADTLQSLVLQGQITEIIKQIKLLFEEIFSILQNPETKNSKKANDIPLIETGVISVNLPLSLESSPCKTCDTSKEILSLKNIEVANLEEKVISLTKLFETLESQSKKEVASLTHLTTVQCEQFEEKIATLTHLHTAQCEQFKEQIATLVHLDEKKEEGHQKEMSILKSNLLELQKKIAVLEAEKLDYLSTEDTQKILISSSKKKSEPYDMVYFENKSPSVEIEEIYEEKFTRNQVIIESSSNLRLQPYKI